MNTDDIDKFGHCVVCHQNLLTKRVVDGKLVDMFLPTYDETFFLLNNGSQMQVTICKTCKSSTDLFNKDVHNNIMAAVQKGWQLETKMLVADEKLSEWTLEKGKEYLDTMSKLSIDSNTDYMDKYAIQQRQMKLLKAVIKPVVEEAEVKSVSNIDS